MRCGLKGPSGEGVTAARRFAFLAPEACEPLLELLDRALDALDLVLDHGVVGDPADGGLDALVDRALQRLETALRGRENLVEETFAAVGVVLGRGRGPRIGVLVTL